jgi:hypothetical protein
MDRIETRLDQFAAWYEVLIERTSRELVAGKIEAADREISGSGGLS